MLLPVRDADDPGDAAPSSPSPASGVGLSALPLAAEAVIEAVRRAKRRPYELTVDGFRCRGCGAVASAVWDEGTGFLKIYPYHFGGCAFTELDAYDALRAGPLEPPA